MTSQEIEEWIFRVLLKLSAAKEPRCVPEIAYGMDSIQRSISYEDLMAIEKELKDRKLVIVVNTPQGSKLYKGFEYFVISSDGQGDIDKKFKTQDFNNVSGTLISALSTRGIDTTLIKDGFYNVALLGYIHEKQVDDTVPLQWIELTFNKVKKDNLYTTTVQKEKVKDKEPVEKGTIGYIYNKELPGLIRLRRLYHQRIKEHLFMSNAVNLNERFQYDNESNDNPMFLDQSQVEGTVPLYLYSKCPERFNVDRILIAPPENPMASPAENVSPSETDLTFQTIEARLIKLLSEKGFDHKKFTSVKDESSVTIALNATNSNFYVNVPIPGVFTTRVHPVFPGESYIKNDLNSWDAVANEFLNWLELIKENSNNTPRVEEPTNFKFQNDKAKAALNVENDASIFFRLIDSIPRDETGLLLGIFGKWGRGKTYFWKTLKNLLGSLSEGKVSYRCVEFHAWKYQDTPASWAYLYEVLSARFYKEPMRIHYRGYYVEIYMWEWLLKITNKFRLNLQRIGRFTLFYGLFVLAFGLVWYFAFDFEKKKELFVNILQIVGVGTIISIVCFVMFYSGTAKDLFRKYFFYKSFVDVLGLQAEIHKEFKDLVSVWIPKWLLGKRRIILFVDDIDRCSESRIIEVIDALKVMMDDVEISKRVVVIAAVDEGVLKRAIKQKYFHMVTNDLSLDKEKHAPVLEDLCREYMDKLFLSGFKLNTLTSDEKIEIIKSLTEGKVRIPPPAPDERNGTADAAEVISKGISLAEATELPLSAIEADATTGATTQPVDDESEITIFELENLLATIRRFKNATPRSIRILYYRFLLARFFVPSILRTRDVLQREWFEDLKGRAILPFLILTYSSDKNHDDLMKEIEKTEELTVQRVTIEVLNEKFSLSKPLYLALLKVVEIVVPY